MLVDACCEQTSYMAQEVWREGCLMPWSHIACSVFAAAVRRPYGFYANRTTTSRFLARRKVIASLAVFFKLTLNFFSETAMPQPHRKVIVRWPYGRLAIAVRWHTVFTLSWVPRKSYGGLTASLRRPHGALTAAVRQTCNSCKNREVAARSPPGLLAVTSRFLISWIVRSSCSRRKTLRFLKITVYFQP